MPITLVDHNGNECGKYTMPLADAQAAFVATCNKVGLAPSITFGEKRVRFSLEAQPMGRRWKDIWGPLRDLMAEVGAGPNDSGDPPWEYRLIEDRPLELAPNAYNFAGDYLHK